MKSNFLQTCFGVQVFFLVKAVSLRMTSFGPSKSSLNKATPKECAVSTIDVHVHCLVRFNLDVWGSVSPALVSIFFNSLSLALHRYWNQQIVSSILPVPPSFSLHALPKKKHNSNRPRIHQLFNARTICVNINYGIGPAFCILALQKETWWFWTKDLPQLKKGCTFGLQAFFTCVPVAELCASLFIFLLPFDPRFFGGHRWGHSSAINWRNQQLPNLLTFSRKVKFGPWKKSLQFEHSGNHPFAGYC